MSDIVFRTAGAWGPGLGADLSADQVDENFWFLYGLIVGLQEEGVAGIDYFVVTGNQLYVHLQDHRVIGPYTLPSATWNFRGAWQASTNYLINDVVTANGAVYLVLWDHTSNPTFSAGSTDGIGHAYYGLLLASPSTSIPNGGATGQRLTVIDGATTPATLGWANPTRVISLYIEGAFADAEQLLQYVVPEQMLFPAGFTGSHAYTEFAPTVSQQFQVFKNGSFVGSVNFSPSPVTASFSLTSPVTFNPGDIMTLMSPALADSHMANVSFSFVATLP